MVMIKNDLLYGNVSANDYGIYISGEGVYNAPERAVELVEVPGRNGSLTMDEGYYRNITIEYPAFTFAKSQREFRRIISDYRNALLSQVGYQRIMDTYNPDEYRVGLYVEGLEVEPVYHGRAGSFTLVFNCKPQRYLISGEDEVEVGTNGSILMNPTAYDALPLIKVDGNGTLTFNGYTLTLTNETYGDIKLFERQTKTSSSLNRGRNISTVATFDRATMNTGDTFTVSGVVAVNMSIRLPSGASNTPAFTAVTTSGTSSYDTIALGYGDSTAQIHANLLSVPSFTIGTADDYDINHTINYTVKISSTTVESSTIALYINIAYDGNSTVTLTARTTYASATNPSTYTNHTLGATINECYATSTQSILGHPTYIDCEIGEAYAIVNGDAVSLNGHIALGSDLPRLSPGTNTFASSDTITSVLVTPRWWKL